MAPVIPVVQASDDPKAALARRLKHARLVQGLTLKALADAAGCSESMLSKVERGHASPSLSKLHRLAKALNTNIAELTSGEENPISPLMRAGERTVIEFGTGRHRASIKLERIIVPSKAWLLQADIHILEPKAKSGEQITHSGEELGFVIEGEFELILDKIKHRLHTGDSFHFISDIPHSYRNPGSSVTRILWINTPPTF
jgi:transcriptional regulator with XRE-family HTH domain